MPLEVICIVTLWRHYHQLIFILGGIYSMQLKGSGGQTGLQQAPRWVTP